MQGYENVTRMYLSVFLLEPGGGGGGGGGDSWRVWLQTNSQTTELEHLIPGVGNYDRPTSSGNFFIKFDDPSKGF